jgi:transcriptional regulator GlxA family with amidase domain
MSAAAQRGTSTACLALWKKWPLHGGKRCSAIAVPDVAAALGVSVRSLQGFRQWRNTTPHDTLRQIRRRLIHAALCRSDEDIDETTVALRHGFTHLGRFSAYYQSAFGELPSTTLRRRRQQARQFKLSGEV